jgi:pSer/pThr/pTyr-binding forkhead associated (FHA) protein/tetratricopeptide (TPR) repeat protein
MKLIIEDDEGRKTVVPLVRDEITIGRQEGNTIRLTERNVSRRHARLVKQNGHVLIEDLGSYNGVRVNGEKITAPTRIKEGDLVEIGDYDLGIQGKLEALTATPAAGTVRPLTIPPGGMKTQPPARPSTLPPQSTPIPGALAAATASASAEKAPAGEKPPPTPSATPNASAGGATAIIRVSDVMKAVPPGESRELERSEMPRLVGLAGPFRAKEFYLMRSEVKFGRTDENDIVADHQSVSRAHARFVLDDGHWKVIDNKSANGVRVNGEEYAVSNLKSGDVIELGHLKFRFCAPGEKFSPPAEKGDDGAQKGGLKPTTAELIAGAQGRQASARPGKSNAGRIGGIAAALVVVGVVGFFATRSRKPPNPDEATGEDAVKQGDALFKQHKYLAAMDMYEKAGPSPAPNKKKADEEARGEEAYNSLRGAIAGGDGDKARNLFERCGGEQTWWCQKAQELGDQVKAAYAKKHLEEATAAKSAGKLDRCLAEVNKVLGFDSSNAEAQALQPQCQPREAARAEPARQEGPTPKDREGKAARLAKASSDKLMARDFPGAVKDAQAALAQSPADKNTLMQAYRSLGYGYAYLNDKANAVKWLEKYLPFCSNDCDQVHAFIGK